MTTNISVAHPSKFRLVFPHLPFLPDTEDGKTEKGDALLLYCSEVTLPDLAMEAQEVPNQFYNGKYATNVLSYGDMEVVYTLDEKFTNYKFLFQWMMYMKDPEEFEVKQDAKVDATLMVYTNNDNPKFKFTLKGIFPVALAGIGFNKKVNDTEDMENSVTFAIEYYKIEELD